jgi:hypothetical protein
VQLLPYTTRLTLPVDHHAVAQRAGGRRHSP